MLLAYKIDVISFFYIFGLNRSINSNWAVFWIVHLLLSVSKMSVSQNKNVLVVNSTNALTMLFVAKHMRMPQVELTFLAPEFYI